MSANCAREYVMMPTFDNEGTGDIMFFKGARKSRGKKLTETKTIEELAGSGIVYFICERACFASAEKGSGKPAFKARSNASRA